MKVLTIQQPWASLIIMGAKKIETRSWYTRHRGPLLIHAATAMPKLNRELCNQKPFSKYIRVWGELPFGKIIGQVTLENVINASRLKENAAHGIIHIPDIEQERAFGDYSSGRYGWYCVDPVPFKSRIPVRGQLGLWEYKEELP